MKQYWMRILGAWFLIRCAQILVRDAEKLMTTPLASKAVIVDAEVIE